jgi:hypothetical protein
VGSQRGLAALSLHPHPPAGPSGTRVTLSYDWSAVPGFLRKHIGFPPAGFPTTGLIIASLSC